MSNFRVVSSLWTVAAVTSAAIAGVGCAPQSGVQSVVVLTSEEQVRQAVETSSPKFFVAQKEDPATWTRAKLFMRQFAGGSGFASKDALRSDGGQGRFAYTISRRTGGTAVQYEVACEEKGGRGTTGDAMMNAKNVSRFLREGELEMSLFQR